MLKIYFIGIIILISAIVYNGLSNKLGILGWYDCIQQFMEKGRHAFAFIRLIDYCWLLFLYPFLLGCAYKLGDYLYTRLMHSL